MLSPRTCQARTGSAPPARVDRAEIAAVEQAADQTPVAGSITTMPGCADSRSRTARFGASPTISRCSLAPTRAEVTDDRHARRDADPALQRRARIGPRRRLTAAHNVEPRADRLFGVVFMRRRDSQTGRARHLPRWSTTNPPWRSTVSETQRRKAAIASRRSSRPTPSARLDVPISSQDMAVICRRSASARGPGAAGSRIASTGGGAMAVRVLRGNRGDEAIPAARHGLDPAVAAGHLAEDLA